MAAVLIRNVLNPVSVALEAATRMTEFKNCQRLRRLEHRLFGLSANELRALETLFTLREAIEVGIQRDEWLRAECERLAGNIRPDADSEATRAEFYTVSQERADNARETNALSRKWQEAHKTLKNTPVGRGRSSTNRRVRFRHEFEHRLACIERGGCCARRCGCCNKSRYSQLASAQRRMHCTPACQCCMKFMEVDRPIPQLDEKKHVELALDVRSKAGAQKMDEFVWGLDTRGLVTKDDARWAATASWHYGDSRWYTA